MTLIDQYFELKKEAGDALILLRLGDFFELFFDDAKIASDKLGLLLTKRDCGLSEPAPMCGFPAHSLNAYANKLASLGFKVAVCEQKRPDISANSANSALMERTVIRIITPGTITDESLLEREYNNYLLSLYSCGDVIGAGWTDVSTGEINYSVIESSAQLNNILSQLNPAEIICNSDMAVKSVVLAAAKNASVCAFTLFDESAFFYEGAFKRLTDKFGIRRVGTMIERISAKRGKCHCVSALGALFAYIDSTKMNTQSVDLLNIPLFDTMKLDSNVCRTLELFSNNSDNKKQGSLIWVLDKTKTAMGARTLRRWLSAPLIDKEAICNRHDGVEKLKDSAFLEEISDNLSSVCDLERTGTRLRQKGLTGKECLRVAQSLSHISATKNRLSQLDSRILNALNADIDGCEQFYRLISRTINAQDNAFNAACDLNDALDEDLTEEFVTLNNVGENSTLADKADKNSSFESGTIKSGVNKRLDAIRKEKDEADQYMQYIISREIELTGLKIKLERSKTFGFCIEVPKSQINQVPYRYKRVQTLAACDRFKTDVLIETEEKISNAENELYALEAAVFDKLTELIRPYGERLVKSAKAVAELDCLSAFASAAKMYNYVRPKMLDNGVINIKDGRHPVVERCMAPVSNSITAKENLLSSFFTVSENDPANIKIEFVANDTYLDNADNKIMLITGPNMSGKSVYMRQVALIAIMAHVGSFIPAQSGEICILEQIFARIGAGDDVSKGCSTFMTEMAEVAEILSSASPRSLILLDEIGRGTSTYDGVSIAWAVLESLASEYSAKVLFSTHYHELTKLESVLKCVNNYKMTIKENENSITFVRKIAKGCAEKSFGIEVAALAGVNRKVLSRAREIMSKLENTLVL